MKKSRNDRIADLMANVPAAPIVSDDYVATLLANEAAKRTELSKRLGIQAYTVCVPLYVVNAALGYHLNFFLTKGAVPVSKSKEINKTFLANTIRGVESHNRREVCVLALAQ